MTESDDHEERIEALERQQDRLPAIEARLDEVAVDAAAARHLGAAVDRDVADLTRTVAELGRGLQGLDRKVDGLDRKVDGLDRKVDANRAAINALGEQTAGGFADMRGRMDGVAAGLDLIARRLEPGGDPPAS